MDKGFLDKFFGLEKKTVFVTGATGQLGKSLSQAYIDAGAKVIGADKDLNKDKMIDSENIEYITLDIANKKEVTEAFNNVYSKYGKLDVLINNAGVSVFEPFEERTEESFDWVTDVNLKGTFFCIQAFVKHLKENKEQGNIINVASFYGVISPDLRIYTDCGRVNSEVYGAAKAGIIQMTKYFAANLAKDDIRVNCISPGGIFNPETPQGEDFVKNYSYRCPMDRMANAEEMVGGVLYLSSEAASYTTGHNLIIDGGMTSW